MDFLEKDLEDIIFNTPNEKLFDRGLAIHSGSVKLRQVNIGNYGICDLISYKRTNEYLQIQLFELKKNVIDINTFNQVCRYARGIQHYLKNRGVKNVIEIILIGKQINKNDSLLYFQNLFSNVCIYTYEFDFDGISFISHQDYILNNPGFHGRVD